MEVGALDEADRLSSEIAVIDHGRIVATGSSAELKAQTGTETLEQAFLQLTGNTIREEEASSLEHAIKAYEVALTVKTPVGTPQDWWRLQRSLAAAYEARIEGDREANMGRAISAYLTLAGLALWITALHHTDLARISELTAARQTAATRRTPQPP